MLRAKSSEPQPVAGPSGAASAETGQPPSPQSPPPQDKPRKKLSFKEPEILGYYMQMKQSVGSRLSRKGKKDQPSQAPSPLPQLPETQVIQPEDMALQVTISFDLDSRFPRRPFGITLSLVRRTSSLSCTCLSKRCHYFQLNCTFLKISFLNFFVWVLLDRNCPRHCNPIDPQTLDQFENFLRGCFQYVYSTIAFPRLHSLRWAMAPLLHKTFFSTVSLFVTEAASIPLNNPILFRRYLRGHWPISLWKNNDQQTDLQNKTSLYTQLHEFNHTI